MGIPHLKTKILLESNPLKSRILVRRLAVAREYRQQQPFSWTTRATRDPRTHATSNGKRIRAIDLSSARHGIRAARLKPDRPRSGTSNAASSRPEKRPNRTHTRASMRRGVLVKPRAYHTCTSARACASIRTRLRRVA